MSGLMDSLFRFSCPQGGEGVLLDPPAGLQNGCKDTNFSSASKHLGHFFYNFLWEE